ncbi:PREDICTED: protein JASON-like [Ipomoea nil]|uniref:protein JASON-like n=1 Tax=Ipomoea nil TaxID=35883 RepID=UPI000901B852|nr:PREDICTED: protein JASON-like [Ipomoea nil]
MVWSWPVVEGRDNCLPLVSAFKFLSAAVLSAAMGCFFSCFRLGGGGDPPTTPDRSRYQLVSQPEAAVPCNWCNLSSLFISDEKEDQYGLEAKGVEKQDIGTPELELNVTELRNQAKFLKACGTLQEAPSEIQKLSKECEDSSALKVVSPNSGSWLPNSSIENQNLVEKPDQPLTPPKNCKEVMEGSDSSVVTPSSYMENGEKSIGSRNGSVSRNTPSIGINANKAHGDTVSSVSPAILPSSTHINKSVRFELESYPTTSAAKTFSSRFASLKSQHSPYPTPLKLTNEMQTPGTVFPSYVNNNVANGKHPRVRYQYVVSTSNRELKELMDEDSTSIQDSTSILLPSDMGKSLEHPNETNLNSEMVLRETVANKELELEASLSSSLNPSLNQVDSNLHFVESVHSGRTPGDRPILGMVAAHWHDHDTSHISPKWWNGNGIPNTTTKYKEDQKVSWHATPFVERLEKALSDETFVSQRKQISCPAPISFNENEGSFAL